VQEKSTGLSFALAYVYVDYKETNLHSESAIILNLARQIAEQCPEIPHEVSAFCDKFTGKKTSSTGEERVALLRKLASRFKTVYIFVDALVQSSISQT
jgi:hypothetical protein